MKNTITQHLKNKSFFLIGIGGAGMMGIAELLHNLGFEVRGSDIAVNSAVERLRAINIKIFIGHDSKNLNKNDIVVFSNAIKRNNIELRYARKNNLTILARMEILAELMRLKYGISITGSHGKTTTTSLLSHILYKNNLDPTYLIGGKLKTDDHHVKLGKSNFLITETDESNPDFTILKPHLVVLTNLDKEHLDNYDNNYSKLKSTMCKFVNSIPFYGKVFINGDDKNSISLIKDINRDIYKFGFSKKNDLFASDVKYENNQMTFFINHAKDKYKIVTNLLGNHNVYNILAAVSVCIHLEINTSDVVKSIPLFHGVKRRLDIHHNIEINGNKTTVIDDYGHHPSEILSTVNTIKSIYPYKKIFMIFQPHRYSRTESTWSDLVKILRTLDRVIILPTYSAGERKTIYDSFFLYQKLRKKQRLLVKTLNGIYKPLISNLASDHVLVLQGAGNIKDILSQLIDISE